MPWELPLHPPSLNPVDEPIYHYTSADGLIGLVRRRELWASEASSLNDLAEMRSGWDLVREWAQRIDSDDPCYSLASDEHGHFPERQSDVFVVSCSTEKDDVSQWRAYGSNGAGYAVELDPSVPLAVLADASAASPPTAAEERGSRSSFEGGLLADHAWVSGWLPVIYEHDQAFDLLDEIHELALDRYWTIESMGPGNASASELEDSKTHLFEELRDDYSDAITTVVHLVKSAGFSGEKEVRAVAGLSIPQVHLKFRSGQNGVVGYLRLTAEAPSAPNRAVRLTSNSGIPKAPLPIRSVTLGSRLSEENMVTVGRMLAQQGIQGCTVEQSKLRMR